GLDFSLGEYAFGNSGRLGSGTGQSRTLGHNVVGQPLVEGLRLSGGLADFVGGSASFSLGNRGVGHSRLISSSGGQSSSQEFPEMGMQGTKVNVFYRDLMVRTIGSVLAAAALGLAYAYPVGRLVRGGGKSVALDKSLQQINGMAILALPLVAQTLGNATK